MRRRHLLQKPVQLRRRHAARALLHHLVDHLEQLRRALAGQRRDVHDRREIEKLQIEAQLVVERLRKILPLAFHQVPFVDRDDHAAPRALGFAGNRAVLIGRAERRVDHQHDDDRHRRSRACASSTLTDFDLVPSAPRARAS